MLKKDVNEQNQQSYKPYYDRKDKCWKVSFPDRDAEEGDLLYVASEFALTGLYFPYATATALGGKSHSHEFEGVLETLLDDPDSFSIEGYEEFYSKQEIKMLDDVQRKLRGQ